MQRLPEPPSQSPLASGVTIVSEEEMRHAETTAARPHPRRDPAVRYSTLVMVGVALIALVVAILYFFRPSPPAPAITSIAQITPLPGPQATVKSTIAASRPTARANARQTPRSAAANQNGSPAATVTGAATTQQTIPNQPVTQSPQAATGSPPPRRVAARPFTNIQPGNPNEPVSLYNVDASFERGGRAVRVFWESSGQAAAQVQLTAANGRVIGQRTVRGQAQTTMLFLPRFYRGPVYIQLVAFGRQGDRVTESTQIGGF